MEFDKPLEELRDTLQINAVILHGSYFGRDALDQMLAEVEADARAWENEPWDERIRGTVIAPDNTFAVTREFDVSSDSVVTESREYGGGAR